MRLFWRVGPDAWHGALASSTHSTATTVTSSKPPRKKYRPSRALHRLAHVFSERKIAPAHSKLVKNGTFTHAGAKNFSQNPTAPHAGAVFLSSQSDPYPTSATKFALLASISAHARKSSPSAHITPQNRPIFACWANFFAVRTRIHSSWANFFAPMGPQLPHNTCRPPHLKPMTLPLARNSQFQAILRPQRRRRFHARHALRPQPKPCVACAHTTTPVAHWPHD